jgi:rhodanese-related sulfurtransferase
MIKYLFSIFLAIFLLMGCAKTEFSDVITMEEFKSSVLANDTIVLDVRTEEEFYGPLGHLEGAMLIPIDELADRMSELSFVKDKTIYVVCRSGNRSGRGKDILNANNFTAVNVNGGMLAWDALTNE